VFNFRKILVVDDSRVYRELASTLLRPYCEEVLMAGSAGEAIACLDDQRDEVDLVICDVVMPGADGFSVLEHVHGLPLPKPRVVMVTATSNPSDQAQASELGAAGYLAKPTTLRQILGCATREGSRSKPRWRCSGSATLLDPESGAPSAFVWDVYNISPGGAFLETKGPVPPASELHLSIELGSHKFRVRARVVRVQQPSWLDIGGVGIEFVGLDAATEALLREALEEPGPVYH
jgi:CheY-like chemotaxis protein